jgi:hypothetical protein
MGVNRELTREFSKKPEASLLKACGGALKIALIRLK